MCRTESRREVPWIEVHSTEAFLSNWGDASGIELRSTESRCNAPCFVVHSTDAFNLNWVEMRCTKAFNLNWGDAQTWLGQLLVF